MTTHRLVDLDIDLDRRQVRRQGVALNVSGLTYDVLACLITHAPAIVPPQTLAQQAWGARHVSDETVAKRIGLLREALGDQARAPRYVRTVRGAGYALAAPVQTGSGVDTPERRLSPVWSLTALAASLALGVGAWAATLGPVAQVYTLTLINGQTGAMHHEQVRDRRGVADRVLVDPETGDVLLRTPHDPAGSVSQAAHLVRLARAQADAGHLDRSERYARAALALSPGYEPALALMTPQAPTPA